MDNESKTLNDAGKPRRCIIIPAYNEEKQIISVVTGIIRNCETEIVVIDDGSEDKTYERALSTGVYVIKHPYNMGAGVAIQTGCKYAIENGYDFLLQIDGDGQHHPAHISDMFSMVEEKGFDIVIGSRFLTNGGYKTGFFKSKGIILFRLIVKLITGATITDPTSGYRCMNKNVFQYFARDNFPWDYPDADIIIDLHRMGFKITEIPVVMSHNPEGKSMHRGVFKIMYYFFKVFLSIFIILLRKKVKS